MNSLEKRMYDSLHEMKESYKLSWIKVSFEDEWLNMDQAQTVSSIAYKAGVDVSMKIGGAEAKRDIRDAKILGVQKVIAPMIESEYAMKKFMDAVSKIYGKDEIDDTDFLINIETITWFQAAKAMLNSPHAEKLSGIVLWRSDFVWSMWKDKSFVNSDEMYNIASELANLCKQTDKKFFVGGNVNAKSIEFFKKLKDIHLDGLETRNVIFNSDVLNLDDVETAITQALKFELLLLQVKNRIYETMISDDSRRIEDIKSRFTKKSE